MSHVNKEGRGRWVQRVHYAEDVVPLCRNPARTIAFTVTSNESDVSCVKCLNSLRARGANGKACTKCDTVYPPTAFYVDKRTGNRHSVCKFCQRKRALAWRYDHYERSIATELARQQRPEVMERRRAQQRAHRARHPQRARARELLSVAIRDGKILRQPCRLCGDPKGQGHHRDYSKPYDVEWLCSTCHGKQHRTSQQGLAAAVRR